MIYLKSVDDKLNSIEGLNSVKMISISDNTATDHLLHLVGRASVEAVSPKSLRPFLSTREMFLLKLSAQAEKLRAQYKSGDLKTRRAVVKSLKSFEFKEVESLVYPRDIQEIEWHVSTRQLCQAMFTLGFHPALMINPGLVIKTII